jgi:uncharacterized protein (TIGR02147 family)
MEALDIYSYLDYRAFCRDFYQTKKIIDDKFSFRVFGRKAGIAGSYLKHVIDGVRNLSPEMTIKFGHGMDLTQRQIDYFENLVRFNQAASLEEKSLYFDRLRRKRARALKPLGLTDAVALLSHWYVVAIKELVVNLNTDNVRIIQRILRKRLPENIIEKAIGDLKELGWLQFKEGRWVSLANQVTFPDEVRSYVMRSFHRQMLEIASEALEDDMSEREFGAAIFTFPVSKLPELKERIKDMQRDLVSYVQDLGARAEADEAQVVYHFGVQCFSLQKIENESEEAGSHVQ